MGVLCSIYGKQTPNETDKEHILLWNMRVSQLAERLRKVEYKKECQYWNKITCQLRMRFRRPELGRKVTKKNI